MKKTGKKTTKKKGKVLNESELADEHLRRHYAALGMAAAAQDKKMREAYINPPAAGSEADVLSGKTLPPQRPPLAFITEYPPCQSFASPVAPFTRPVCEAELWHRAPPRLAHRLYLQRVDAFTSACPVCGHKAAYYEWKKYQTRPVEWRPKIHWLKILPRYFYALSTRRKAFEIRRNDRDYRVGDNIIFQMWSPAQGSHGRSLPMTITYITDYPDGLRPGYVVLGVKPL